MRVTQQMWEKEQLVSWRFEHPSLKLPAALPVTNPDLVDEHLLRRKNSAITIKIIDLLVSIQPMICSYSLLLLFCLYDCSNEPAL